MPSVLEDDTLVSPTMLSPLETEVPHTMLSPSVVAVVPQTMLSPASDVPHTMLSPTAVPQTMLSPAAVPQTMLSPLSVWATPHVVSRRNAFFDRSSTPLPPTRWLPQIR